MNMGNRPEAGLGDRGEEKMDAAEGGESRGRGEGKPGDGGAKKTSSREAAASTAAGARRAVPPFSAFPISAPEFGLGDALEEGTAGGASHDAGSGGGTQGNDAAASEKEDERNHRFQSSH